MGVLVDTPVWPGPGGRLFAHLVSDDSFEELHAFARRLGVPERAFERDHYDIPEELHPRALELGAEHVDGRELVTRLRAAGLRRPKHPGRSRSPEAPRPPTGEPVHLGGDVGPGPGLPPFPSEFGVEEARPLQQ